MLAEGSFKFCLGEGLALLNSIVPLQWSPTEEYRACRASVRNQRIVEISEWATATQLMHVRVTMWGETGYLRLRLTLSVTLPSLRSHFSSEYAEIEITAASSTGEVLIDLSGYV